MAESVSRPVTLASASPRRLALLTAAGFEVVVRPADIDEWWDGAESPPRHALRVAEAKAGAALGTRTDRSGGEVVLAADTVVDLAGEVLGKPALRDQAIDMLTALSGRCHLVHTAVVVRHAARPGVVVVTTQVTMRALSADEIRAYVDTGEPLDKAGAYAIQGGAVGFIDDVRGSVTNVIGLPVGPAIRLLAAAGCHPFTG